MLKKLLSAVLILNILSSCSLTVKKAYYAPVQLEESKFCYINCPIGYPSTNLNVDHDIFILSYNIRTKYADWVAYKIESYNVLGFSKQRVWRADPKLPEDIALIPSDYKDASITCNYDRGHQAPLADFSNNINWERTNYLSNITPQKSELNNGPWNRLEAKVRQLVKTFKDIYVLTGPYYTNRAMCKLPKARIPNKVPNGYWKIITVVEEQQVYTASFVFDQETPKSADYCNYTKSIGDIEGLTNLKFNKPNSNNSSYLFEKLGCN